MRRRNCAIGIWEIVLLLASLIITAGGCSTASKNVRFQPNFVSPAETRIEIGTVTSEAKDEGNVDPSKRLADALRETLERDRLLLPQGTKNDHLILTTTILEYQEGYQFMKGILPSSVTVLSVHGDLKDSATGAVVESVDVRRTIGFYHPFAFGSWARIFGTVAKDMVSELRPGSRNDKTAERANGKPLKLRVERSPLVGFIQSGRA